MLYKLASPSSRKAWIETHTHPANAFILIPSPSSRKAWIETAFAIALYFDGVVAFLPEGVD